MAGHTEGLLRHQHTKLSLQPLTLVSDKGKAEWTRDGGESEVGDSGERTEGTATRSHLSQSEYSSPMASA